MSATRAVRRVALVGALVCTLGTAGCAGSGNEDQRTGTLGRLVGIAMPTQSLDRWNRDGAHLDELLKADGFTTSVQFADNKPDVQATQLQAMIDQGAEILVVAAVDGTKLAPVLAQAKAKDVTVVAYDRLINSTPDVDYYATFDNYKVGQLQGQFIEQQLGLKDGKGPFTLEPFAGSPDDNNAKFFFAGAWDVLRPYVESGRLVVPSGKAPASNEEWTGVGILGWGSDTAQAEMANRLAAAYPGGARLDVVLSPNDSVALGVERALEAAGYAPGKNWPIITGQDADLPNVMNMLAGRQSMTVWKDTRMLGDQVANMIGQIAAGQTVDVNDTTNYDNGVKLVPTYLLPPQVVTPDQVPAALIASGFYQASDLGL